MLCSFLFQLWKLNSIPTINLQSQSLGQERENILHHYLWGDKIIQNSLKIDAPRKYDNDLLLRQETQKILHFIEINIITIEKKKKFMSLAQRMHFLPPSRLSQLLATVVEGHPKAPFSIATTRRCWKWHYSFSWIAPLYPWSLPYNAEC